MNDDASFDHAAAHRYFAAHCFNQAWDLIEKSTRTSNDDLELVRLAQASLWHWTQVPDHTATNLSVGYWQISRVYALLEDHPQARRYGEACLQVSRDGAVEPFYLAYAFEALARASAIEGDQTALAQHLEEARNLAAGVEDQEARLLLLQDLSTIG